MEREKLVASLSSLKEKIIGVEDLLEETHNDGELEFELQDLEEELDNFRFYLEERTY